MKLLNHGEERLLQAVEKGHIPVSIAITITTSDDKVVQQTAANAEESASAAEEMTAQAMATNTVVKELIALIQGGKADSGEKRPAEAERAPAAKAAAAPKTRALAKPGTGEVKPGEVIPLDDDDFTSF